jgi:hypothetical protein
VWGLQPLPLQALAGFVLVGGNMTPGLSSEAVLAWIATRFARMELDV